MRKRLERIETPAGERMKQEYTAVVLPDGSFNLVEAGETDLQEYINSFAESVSIEHILAMCAAGDTSALSVRQGSYIDTTEMPKTFRDCLDIVIKGKAQFDSLPVEVKQKFDNDFQRWFSEAGDESWLTNMGFVTEKPEEKVEVETNAES